MRASTKNEVARGLDQLASAREIAEAYRTAVLPQREQLVISHQEEHNYINLSMWNHPMHLHGVEYFVTGSDGGRWPRSQWRRETTEIVGVGQTRDIEFIARPGDWVFHCHKAHHAMNAIGHDVPNLVGVDQQGVEPRLVYDNPRGAVAHRVSDDPNYGDPPRPPLPRT